MNTHLNHVLDLEIETAPDSLDLFAEELQPNTHSWSDCASTVLCGSCSMTAATASTVGSIISCGS